MKQDREAVRTLAIAIGVRPAARQLGLNEDTVCSWAKREGWFAPKPKPPSQAINTQALQAKPGDVLLDEIEQNGKATKLSLSRYAKRAAQDSEQLSTRDAPLVHKVAQVAQIVHPEQFNPKGQDQAQVAVNIAILNA